MNANTTTRVVGLDLHEVVVDGKAVGRVRYDDQFNRFFCYDIAGLNFTERATWNGAVTAVADLAGIDPAPLQSTPTNFDGYLMLMVLEGSGPMAWRITRDQTATCESCDKGPEDTVQPIYRTISLTHENDPQLGMCQDCAQLAWSNRVDPTETPDGTGSRFHMYPPR